MAHVLLTAVVETVCPLITLVPPLPGTVPLTQITAASGGGAGVPSELTAKSQGTLSRPGRCPGHGPGVEGGDARNHLLERAGPG